jgi:hypothetical protein
VLCKWAGEKWLSNKNKFDNYIVREFESLIINQEMAQILLDEHLQKYAHLSSDIQTIKL